MITSISAGQCGVTLVSAGESLNGETSQKRWIGFLALAPTTIDGLKGSITGAGDLASLDGVTLPAGIYVPCPFNKITVASGTILAINDI
jgi:hypothetical protein